VTVCHCNDFKNNINRFDISYKKKKKKKKNSFKVVSVSIAVALFKPSINATAASSTSLLFFVLSFLVFFFLPKTKR
jgi:hypothetical protein